MKKKKKIGTKVANLKKSSVIAHALILNPTILFIYQDVANALNFPFKDSNQSIFFPQECVTQGSFFGISDPILPRNERMCSERSANPAKRSRNKEVKPSSKTHNINDDCKENITFWFDSKQRTCLQLTWIAKTVSLMFQSRVTAGNDRSISKISSLSEFDTSFHRVAIDEEFLQFSSPISRSPLLQRQKDFSKNHDHFARLYCTSDDQKFNFQRLEQTFVQGASINPVTQTAWGGRGGEGREDGIWRSFVVFFRELALASQRS